MPFFSFCWQDRIHFYFWDYVSLKQRNVAPGIGFRYKGHLKAKCSTWSCCWMDQQFLQTKSHWKWIPLFTPRSRDVAWGKICTGPQRECALDDYQLFYDRLTYMFMTSQPYLFSRWIHPDIRLEKKVVAWHSVPPGTSQNIERIVTVLLNKLWECIIMKILHSELGNYPFGDVGQTGNLSSLFGDPISGVLNYDAF